MKKSFKIRKRRDFIAASVSGVYKRTDVVVSQATQNNLEKFRCGFTASKKVGGAVERNRCKRRLRNIANIVLPTHAINGVDYVFIAKKTTANCAWNDLINCVTDAVVYMNTRIIKFKSKKNECSN